MQLYVCGFIINRHNNTVLLIQKNRPAFQAGKWNGIGGKVEPNESPFVAMVRECREESGVDTLTNQWTWTIRLRGSDFQIDYFRLFADEHWGWMPNYASLTDEPVAECNIDKLMSIPTLDNLKWILPFQLQTGAQLPIHVRWLGSDDAKKS